MYKMCKRKVLQLTLAIIKPHVIKQPHALQGIRDQIISNEFKVIRSRRTCLSLEQAEHFYVEHKYKFFYNRLVTFMTSGPSEFYILARDNAITEWRKLMGPTKVFKAQFSDPESIRGKYGLSDTRNATHGSDSPESAAREIHIFFPDFDFKAWYDSEELMYRKNLVKFLENEFIHVPYVP